MFYVEEKTFQYKNLSYQIPICEDMIYIIVLSS